MMNWEKIGKVSLVSLFVVVALGVIFYVIPSLQSAEYVDAQMISKTEYVPNDDGQVIVQMRNALTQQALSASCYASIQYPNKSVFVTDQVMNASGVGTYYYNFTVPSTEGVYEYQARCEYDGANYTTSKAFHVSSSFRLLNEEIDKGYDIISQGVSQVELWKTAAESWRISAKEAINLSEASCMVYHVDGLAKTFVTGVKDSYTFDTGLPVEMNVTNKTISSYTDIFDGSPMSWMTPGDVIWAAGSADFDTYVATTAAWGIIPFDTELDGDWEFSFDVSGLWGVVAGSNFRLVLLTYDRYGGKKLVNPDGSSTDIHVARNVPVNNSVVGFGINGNGGTVSYVYIVNGSQTAALSSSAIFPSGIYHTIKFVKSGSDVDLYIDSSYNHTYTITDDPIVGIGMWSEVPSNSDTHVDNIIAKVSVDSSDSNETLVQAFGEDSLTFTYYWLPESPTIQRGENYAVECDVVVNSGDGEQTIESLIQYVYVNREGRLRAVTVK